MEVIQILTDVFVKFFLASLAALILLTLTIVTIVNPSWPIAALDAIFAVSVAVVYRHYFPAASKAKCCRVHGMTEPTQEQ